MIKVGTNINKGNREYPWKGSPYRKKSGIIRSNTAILLVFAVCILITATRPVSAMVINDAGPSSATDQSATCPCKSQSSSQSITPAVQPQAVDASILNQLVQSTYSPGNTAQQAAGYTPQYSTTTVPVNAANVNTITPVSVQNNAGTTEATGVAPAADFSRLFSRWINNEIDSSVPGYSLKNPTNQMFGINPMYTMNDPMASVNPVYTAKDQTVGINPMFTGWQMSPINMVRAPMQANWLN